MVPFNLYLINSKKIFYLINLENSDNFPHCLCCMNPQVTFIEKRKMKYFFLKNKKKDISLIFYQTMV